MRIASIILVVFLLTPLASAKQFPAPTEYDQPALKADCDKYLQSLDSADFAKNYPKLLKNLLSIDRKTQYDTLLRMGTLAEINSLPILVTIYQNSANEIRLFAAVDIETTISHYSRGRYDYTNPNHPTLRPLTKDEPDFRPLAWIVLTMLRDNDPQIQTNGAVLAGYLELRQFKSELQTVAQSP